MTFNQQRYIVYVVDKYATRKDGKMTNTEELECKIKEKGISYKYISECLGISYQALRNKMDNKTEFKGKEISTLSDILGISTLKEQKKIFFNIQVDKNATR